MIEGCIGAIVAGGKSARMGRDKAFLPFRGATIIESQMALLGGLFGRVLISANDLEKFARLGCPVHADRLPGGAPLLGIHTMLLESPAGSVFAAACDMPFLDGGLIEHLAGLREGSDAVVPWFEGHPEPLHAFYHRRCAPAIEEQWRTGDLKIARFLERVRVVRFELEGSAWQGRGARSLINVNTPEELERYLSSPASPPPIA